MTTRTQRVMLAVAIPVALVLLTLEAAAQEQWFASPDGKTMAEGGAGSLENPWDLETALTRFSTVGPGDTVWLLGGAYFANRESGGHFRVRLSGSSSAPVTVRNYQNQRAIIDGGLLIDDAARGKNLIIWGLELIVSERLDSATRDLRGGGRLQGPAGGITAYHGENLKLINNVIHAAVTGINVWSPVNGAEIYGNIICDNGYIDEKRYHGPGIYTQNRRENEPRHIRHNFILENYSTPVQIYGSARAHVHHFFVEENFIQPLAGSGRPVSVLGGDGREDNPSTNLHARKNIVYSGVIQLGFGQGHGADLSAIDNHIYRGGISQSGTLTSVTLSGNWVWNEGDALPSAPIVFVQQNEYEPNRLHVAIFKWGNQARVDVDLTGHLNIGDHYEFRDPTNLFREPALAGKHDGSPIQAPAPGEFSAFLVLVNHHSGTKP